MLTPKYILEIGDRTNELVADLQSWILSDMVRRITARLDRGDDYLVTSTDLHHIRTMRESGLMLEDIQGEITKRLPHIEREIKAAIEDAGVKAMETEDELYKASGLSPTPLRQSPGMIRQMQRVYEATKTEVRNLTRTTAIQAQDTFITELDNAYMKTVTGAQGKHAAIAEAIRHCVKHGAKIHYPTGHEENLEVAVSRAVRTGITQSSGDIIMTRLEEMDWDIILTSAHYGARTGDGGENPGNHSWWQGRFFSRTGRTPDFPNFYEYTGYGTITGLCGINCRHTFGAGDGKFNPYENIDPEENARIEKINQTQRRKEREIRKTKRDRAAYESALESAESKELREELEQEYRRLDKQLRRQKKAYNEFCKANGAKPQAERLKISEDF